jgi:hypothetical protein
MSATERGDGMGVITRWECDGGYACFAAEHIEGCFTGEGDPDAAKGLYVAALRDQRRGAVYEQKALGTYRDAIFEMDVAPASREQQPATEEDR